MGVAAPATVDLKNFASAPQTGKLDPAAAWLGGASGARQEIADQETMENVVITPTGGHLRDAANGPAPWPLPIGDILMGRYRVESVVRWRA